MQLTWSQQNKKTQNKTKKKTNKRFLLSIELSKLRLRVIIRVCNPNKLFHLDNLTHNSPTCV